MNTLDDLRTLLHKLDGKGYKAYKELAGRYHHPEFTLSVDYVQADPFAGPSRIRVTVPGNRATFDKELYDTPWKKRAVVDFLSRQVASAIREVYDGVGGTGKSGLLAIGHCGQEIMDRNYVVIDDEKVEARLEVGLPAGGRRILGRKAAQILVDALPRIVRNSLHAEALDEQALWAQVRLVEDQTFIRDELERQHLVAFVADDSILPRESGISQRPMNTGAVSFTSPPELAVELDLPHRGRIRGMGIPEGVTLIVGGGFHGKTTLLNAIELGIYDHRAGDGREYVVSRQDGVKIKAENGRSVQKVDISPFIANLPLKQDTVRFSSENASGSTSQAAGIVEALEADSRLLFIDEDTSATNFMIRDGRMQQLVHKDKEPITPFIDRVRTLYESMGVSTVLVIGGSGDYFSVADQVIMMDEYHPRDVTARARKISREAGALRQMEAGDFPESGKSRILLKQSFPSGSRGMKIRARGLERMTFNRTDIDLRDLEQLVDPDQVNTLAFVLETIAREFCDNQTPVHQVARKVILKMENNGLDSVSSLRGHPGNMAGVRMQDIAAVLNRFRGVRIG